MAQAKWQKIGVASDLQKHPLQQITIDRTKIALSYANGRFGAVSGVCNHAAGPLGDGKLDGDYIVCPWHHWKFHRENGKGEPGFEEDCVPQYEIKVENSEVWVNLTPISKRHKAPHPPHPLARKPERINGKTRVAGISTTVMENEHPRFSTSDFLLEHALAFANTNDCDTRLLKLNNLNFRACEGFYSKSAHACTWPCSITQMDEKDQMDQVYEALVHWADVLLISTPIRWGAASSLYYKMAERMNCIQNQITIANKTLIRNKVASFIITGGQDNVQAVAGQMLGFFAELGFLFPQYPYIAHSRGWSAEDMEANVKVVAHSRDLQEAAEDLVRRSVDLSKTLLQSSLAGDEKISRGGRKAHALLAKESPPKEGL